MAYLDVAGKRWPITLTVLHRAELRRRLDFNIDNILKPNSPELARLADDLPLLLDVLALLLEKELLAHRMQPPDLFELFDSETPTAAFFAILDAYVEHLPESQRKLTRPLVDEFRAGFRSALAKTEQQASARLAAMPPGALAQEFEAHILAAVTTEQRIPGRTSTPGG